MTPNDAACTRVRSASTSVLQFPTSVVNWTLKQTFAKLLKNLLICESQRRSRLIKQSSSRRRQTNKAEDKVAAHNFYYKIFRATLQNIFDFKMMTTLLQIVLALAIITTVVDSAAIGDIARNVHSDLLTLDAGLNPQPVRSPRQDFDVPAGMLTLTPFFY